MTIERFDRRLCPLVIFHLDEAKSFGSIGISVHNDLGGSHFPILCEHVLQIATRDTVRQIADVNILTHQRAPSNGLTHPTTPRG